MTKLLAQPTYELESGITLKLAPVPPFLLHTVMTHTSDIPQAPYVEVRRAKKVAYEQNFSDENYLRALEHFEQSQQAKIMFLMFTKGVVGVVEDYVTDKTALKEIKELAEFVYGSDYTANQLKYIWLTNELPTVDEIAELQRAIEEVASPSQESIEDSKSDI